MDCGCGTVRTGRVENFCGAGCGGATTASLPVSKNEKIKDASCEKCYTSNAARGELDISKCVYKWDGINGDDELWVW